MAQLRATVGDETKFQNWFAGHYKNKKTGNTYDPDDDVDYDWRGAYQGGAQPDAGGNWPQQYRRRMKSTR